MFRNKFLKLCKIRCCTNIQLYIYLSLKIKALTIINHNEGFSKKTQKYLTLKEPANVWLSSYIYVCVGIFIHTHLKIIYCKVLLEASLLSVLYLSSPNYSVASGKTNLGKENFQLNLTSNFFIVFGLQQHNSYSESIHRLLHPHAGLTCSSCPTYVSKFLSSLFCHQSITKCKVFPLQAKDLSGSGSAH